MNAIRHRPTKRVRRSLALEEGADMAKITRGEVRKRSWFACDEHGRRLKKCCAKGRPRAGEPPQSRSVARQRSSVESQHTESARARHERCPVEEGRDNRPR